MSQRTRCATYEALHVFNLLSCIEKKNNEKKEFSIENADLHLYMTKSRLQQCEIAEIQCKQSSVAISEWGLKQMEHIIMKYSYSFVGRFIHYSSFEKMKYRF